MSYFKRSARGSATVLSTVLALVLVVLGVGFLFFTLYMGGQRETKNAVDAGALNTAKQAMDKIDVHLMGGDNQTCFRDVASDNGMPSIAEALEGKITLRRINRVWAKALLIAINADAAQKDGNAGQGPSNANSAHSGAKAVSDALAAELSNESNLHGFFTDLAGKNSVRMLGTTASITPIAGNGWQTSFMERGDESNIVVGGSKPAFCPPGYSMPGSMITQTTRNPKPAAANNMYFLKGYEALNVGGKDYWQVPFLFDEKPHLVAGSIFESSGAKNKLQWNNAVPNAFSVHGKAQKQGAPGEEAKSWALTNPRQPFKISMPYSFMKIHVDENKVKFFYFPAPAPIPVPGLTEGSYDYTTNQVSDTNFPGGILCSNVTVQSVTVGTDVVGRPLDQIIFGIPGGNTDKLEGLMTARCNEMISKIGVTIKDSDMHSCLMNPLTIGWLIAGERDFYVFSPDGESLTCQPKTLAIAMAPWLATMIDKKSDGTETKMVDDATSPAPIFFKPIVVPAPFCTEAFSGGTGTWNKDLYWTPGSGFNGNLGTIRAKRWTEIYTVAVCNPL